MNHIQKIFNTLKNILGLASGYTLTVMKAARKFKDGERAKDKVGLLHYFIFHPLS